MSGLSGLLGLSGSCHVGSVYFGLEGSKSSIITHSVTKVGVEQLKMVRTNNLVWALFIQHILDEFVIISPT